MSPENQVNAAAAEHIRQRPLEELGGLRPKVSTPDVYLPATLGLELEVATFVHGVRETPLGRGDSTMARVEIDLAIVVGAPLPSDAPGLPPGYSKDDMLDFAYAVRKSFRGVTLADYQFMSAAAEVLYDMEAMKGPKRFQSVVIVTFQGSDH